jgi:hypothetical protein
LLIETKGAIPNSYMLALKNNVKLIKKNEQNKMLAEKFQKLALEQEMALEEA